MDFEIGTKVVETAGFFKGSEFIVTGEYLGTNGTFGERKLISPELPKKTHTPRSLRIMGSKPVDGVSNPPTRSNFCRIRRRHA